MDPAFIVATIIIGFLLLGLFISKKLSSLQSSNNPSQELLEVIKMIQNSSQADRRTLLRSLQSNTESLNLRLDNAAKVIGEVQKNIGEMSEIGRSMKDLQEFLQSPKLRGNVGEQILKELLEQMLPKSSFHLQYAFKTGSIVDAAIKTSGGIIPIDSKFPMENFRKMMAAKSDIEKTKSTKLFERDVKHHVDSISKKYILTDEGTIDYALMYIPSEAVYYEIVNNPKLFEHAGHKRVLPVSPTTFYAFMKSILMSFEGQKINENAKEILSALRAIKKDYSKVEDNLSTLQKHLNNANNMLGTTLTSFSKLGQKISNTSRLENKDKKSLS